MSTTEPLFAGSIIANYDQYLTPLLFEEYAQDLAARAEIPTGRVQLLKRLAALTLCPRINPKLIRRSE